MKNIKLQITWSILFAFICIIFTQCKSVEFTFLGYFEKKYHKEIKEDKPLLESEKDIFVLDEERISVTGVITDNKMIEQIGLDIYLIKEKTIKYHTITNEKGVFYFLMPAPDTIDMYILKSPDGNYELVIENLIVINDTILTDFVI
jgi:hypothetical protein